jgi:hypothetical protein
VNGVCNISYLFLRHLLKWIDKENEYDSWRVSVKKWAKLRVTYINTYCYYVRLLKGQTLLTSYGALFVNTVNDNVDDLDFQRHMSWLLCIQWVQLRSEVIVRFVDIGGIYYIPV